MLMLGSNFDICYITSIFKSYGWSGWSGWTGRDEYGNPYALLDVNSTKSASSPLYFLYSGYIDYSLLQYAGSNGFYWSSTALSAAAAYRLLFDSSSVTPSSNSNRYVGFSVRCVAR